MEFRRRKAVWDDLKKYDILAKEGDFIEVTEWTNGEGVDITISDRPPISLTFGMLSAIQYLVTSLDIQDE